jgi:undecaprenyl-diphosphatase
VKQESKKSFYIAVCMLAVFVLWTAAIQFVDVQAIGPRGSTVGFAAVNGLVHSMTGVHMTLYTITDWMGLIPLGIAMGFACLGLVQWIQRKQLRKVDASILMLGGFYLAVMAAYLFFESVVINYRPVLIEGGLEASYPSSTTMLVLCVMPTAWMQFRIRIRNDRLRRCVATAVSLFVLFMVLGRLVSGVHWLSDIIGGILLSGGLVMLYDAVCRFEPQTR